MSIVIVVLVLVALVAAAGWWFVFRASMVVRSGTFKVDGLVGGDAGAVEIVRDEWGVPHIHAGCIEDACFGQGWVHAQDRLWQMELNRRVGAGRLAEILGGRALEADRFLRRVGLARAAKDEASHLMPEERRVLEAYARGVNAAVAAMGWRRPLEFRLLGIRWEAWQVTDTLAWAKVMALNLSANADGEMFRAKLVAKVGVDRAILFELHDPSEVNVVVPPGTTAKDPADDLKKLYDAARPFLSAGLGSASNNWVVSGKRTESGKPMLANDPHLQLSIPSTWYEAHLIAGDLDVYGVSMPGSPGIVIGHNRDVAWGLTNSFADVQDLYLEKFDAANPDFYEFEGKPVRAQVVEERIRVKGGADVVERVVITRHGPVMAPARDGKPALALRWTAHEPGHLVAALLGMNGARNAAEFREALRDWHTPSQNVVFADTEGNIGYVMAGAVPIRAKGDGFTPVPGWTGEYEWTGVIPFEKLPQAWNPECGYVVTANNAVVDHHASSHHISWDYMNGYRAQRIEDLLTATPKVGKKEFRDIQMDVWCRPGKQFAAQVKSRRIAGADALQRRVAETLGAWDGTASAESAGAAIYESMMLATVRRAFEPELGKELVDELLGKSPHPLAPASMVLGKYVRLVVRGLLRDDRRYFTSPSRDWNAVLEDALTDATADLTKRFGHDDVSRWEWGALHRMAIAHPLGAMKPLHLVFRGTNIPIGGDTDTPLQTAYVPGSPFNASAWAPSWRQIVDLADLRKTVSIFATGQSGHPGSRHYLDQFPLWARGEYHPQWLDRADIEAHAESWLRLEP